MAFNPTVVPILTSKWLIHFLLLMASMEHLQLGLKWVLMEDCDWNKNARKYVRYLCRNKILLKIEKKWRGNRNMSFRFWKCFKNSTPVFMISWKIEFRLVISFTLKTSKNLFLWQVEKSIVKIIVFHDTAHFCPFRAKCNLFWARL